MINWREIERIEIRTENKFNTAVIIFDSQGRSSVPPKIKWTDYLKNESVSRSLVCYTAIFSVVTQRSSPLVERSVAWRH